VFADLDETIRRLLVRHVPLDPAEVDVSFETPDREWSGRLSRPSINCFLYDVRENHQLRETDFEVRRVNGRTAVKAKSPLRVDATYQVSVWARAPEDEHRLLWRVLATLARFPLLPDDVAQGGMRDQQYPVPAQVAQPEQAPRNAADLWQVIDNRIRPSLTYVVTVALDPGVVFTSSLVFTRVTRLQDRLRERPGAEDGSAGGEGLDEAIEIGGRVRGRGEGGRPGDPVSGAIVVVRESGASTTTDEEGRFRFRRVPRGQVTLAVRAPGRREVSRRTTVPSPEYDVEV
jgi:hypothetical protein